MAKSSTTTKLTEVFAYAGFAAYLNELIQKWEEERDAKFNQADAGKKTGIQPSSISKFTTGRNRPTPEQCLILAGFFKRPVEEVLNAAGYPDIAGLRKLIEEESVPRDEEVKKRVIDILRIAENAPLWRNLSSANPYKDHANRILASTGDAWQKALDYTDTVYFWSQSRDRDTPRGLRKTDDMLPIVS